MTATAGEQPTRGYTHGDAWDSGLLPVGHIHRIYYEQWGNPHGKPVCVLHGGPGGSTSKDDTVYFDPAVYRIVLHHQRGAGRSLPPADLRDNTSQHLVADIEALRSHLGISRWHLVFGGSWGSTLSLLYAETHPDVVGSLIIRGIYTVRRSELDFMKGRDGTAHLFPEEYEAFLAHLDPKDRDDPYPAYHRLLTSDDEAICLPAARAWNRWELSVSALQSTEQTFKKLDDKLWSLQHARIEIHYETNGAFMEEGQLLKPENIEKIRHIPCGIVQGRYDLVCPAKTAWELHKALPNSELHMIPDAGHASKEPGIRKMLIALADEFGKL